MVSYRVPFAKWSLSYYGMAALAFTAIGIWLITRFVDHGTPAQVILVVCLTVFNLLTIARIFLREPTSIRLEDDGSIVFASPLTRTRHHVMDVKNIVPLKDSPNLLQMNFVTDKWIRYRTFPDHDQFVSDLRNVNPNFEYQVE